MAQENYQRLNKQFRAIKDREEDMLRQIAQAEQNMEQVCASRAELLSAMCSARWPQIGHYFRHAYKSLQNNVDSFVVQKLK